MKTSLHAFAPGGLQQTLLRRPWKGVTIGVIGDLLAVIGGLHRHPVRLQLTLPYGGLSSGASHG